MPSHLVKCLISSQSGRLNLPQVQLPFTSESSSKLKGASLSSSVVLAITFKRSATGHSRYQKSTFLRTDNFFCPAYKDLTEHSIKKNEPIDLLVS